MMWSRKKERKELIAKLMNNVENPQLQESDNRIPHKLMRRNVIIVVIIAIFVIFAIAIGINISYYNMFVNLSQDVKDARADVETTLQLRENMVPTILTTINEFVTHENEIFIHAADVRARSLENKPQSSGSEPNPSGSPVPADDWDKMLSQLFAIAESYPYLKTGEPFQLLMSKIADAETEILNKRVGYNKKVRELNVKVISFPSSIFSYIFKIKPEPYFQWTSKPEWVSTLDEETRKRTDEMLEKWRSTLIGADTVTVR